MGLLKKPDHNVTEQETVFASSSPDKSGEERGNLIVTASIKHELAASLEGSKQCHVSCSIETKR